MESEDEKFILKIKKSLITKFFVSRATTIMEF
jgi:hypothetical protein